MQNELKIVGIQADLIWENPDGNIAYFDRQIQKLDNVDLIVLPEMFTTGFTMNPEKIAEEMNGFSVNWMRKIAIKKQTALTGSIAVKENNQFYNRLIFVHPSGKIETYNKRHSFTLAGEDKVYTSGRTKLIVDYKGWKICPLICYDLRFPVWARNTENFDVLIYMANWPVQRIKAWETLLKARAIENMSYCIGVNRIGTDANNYKYSGNSIIADYLGEELSNLPKDKSGIIKTSILKNKLEETRNKLGFLNDKDQFTIDL